MVVLKWRVEWGWVGGGGDAGSSNSTSQYQIRVSHVNRGEWRSCKGAGRGVGEGRSMDQAVETRLTSS